MKIGIICPSEIALRRFMPALQLVNDLEFVGLAVCTKEERFENNNVDQKLVEKVLKLEYEKAKVFIDLYGGKIFEGYNTIVTSKEIDALYIPLPPALHFKWAKLALENGKHVLVEKPATTSLDETKELVRIAKKKGLALHENYMFAFHNQLDYIDTLIKNGKIGDVRLYRISFGFPMRAINDFRYNKALGGGALIDAGGYTIKYASRLLGNTARIKYAQMNNITGFEVDMFGSGALVNDDGVTAQIAFGMDNNYKCDLEVWGSKGCLTTGRILTAPAGFTPTAIIRQGNDNNEILLPCDDSFKKSIEFFITCIKNKQQREIQYKSIIHQAELVDQFKKMATK